MFAHIASQKNSVQSIIANRQNICNPMIKIFVYKLIYGLFYHYPAKEWRLINGYDRIDPLDHRLY